MTEKEAIEFLRTHAASLKAVWSTSPEGRDYFDRFMNAIDTLDGKLMTSSSPLDNDILA